jgi:PAS domain S-box-containing protein
MPPPRILVIESNPITSRIVVHALRAEGFFVLEAGDAASAIALLGERPDLVLLDDLPPGEGAPGLGARIRAAPGCGGVPIIALGGRAVSGTLGVDDVLEKPIDAARLVEAVRAHLPSESGRRERQGLGRRVLVAERDPVTAKLLAARLARCGFQVSLSSEGRSALELARDQVPAAIVSDVLLPGLDGFKLCAAVRGEARLAGARVVLISAFPVEERDAALAASVGASALVLGAPSLEGVVDAVLEALRAAIPGAPAAGSAFGPEYTERLLSLLERQAVHETDLARSCAFLAAELSILGGVSAALTGTEHLDVALGAVLAQGLDAVGISIGVVHLKDEAGAFVRRATFGPQPTGACAEKLEARLAEAAASARIRTYSGGGPSVLAPLIFEGEVLGVLALGPCEPLTALTRWVGFAEAFAARLAEALALRKTVAALRESEARARGLLGASSDAIVTIDERGTIQSVSAVATEMFGYRESELIGENVKRLMPRSFADDHDASLARYLRTRERRIIGIGREVLGRRKDGSVFPVDLAVSEVTLGNRRIFTGALRDVSQRKRAEETLRESQAFLEKAQQVGSMGLWVSGFAPEDRVIWSRETYRIFGLSPGTSMTVEGFFDLVHLDDRAGVFTSLARALANGTTFEIEHRIVRPDGETRWVHERGDVAGKEPGEDERLVGVVHDVNELRLAQEQLVARARQQAAVASLSQRALRERDVPTLLTDATSLVAATLGVECVACSELNPDGQNFTIRAAVGLPAAGIGRESSADPEETFSGFTLSQGKTVVVEDLGTETRFKVYEPLRALGLESAFSAVLPGPERPHGVIVVGSRARRSFSEDDVHFLQAIANVLAASIERRRGDEALGRSEEQLRQSQKMEAVGRLAGGVAHDFNNLLTAINGYSELLIAGLGAGDPLRKHASEIARAGKRAASLTQQLLAFSRKQVLRPKVLCPNTVVADFEKLLTRLVGEHIEVSVRLAPDLGNVRVDPGQLEQVLMNLVVNARDAMPRGGHLTLATGNTVRDEKAFVRITVSDDGCGMSEETLSHVFEPFFTTKEQGKGTGLGLSTCYGIVEQSGGRISVLSAPDEGTTVEVCLLRVNEAADGSDSAGLAVSARRGSEVILLVEDDELVRRLGIAVLEMTGYTVLAASDGAEGLRTCEAHRGQIDLILTDVVMPKLSGPEFVARARAHRPTVRVLFTSGYTDSADVHHGDLRPDAPFIQKPFSPASLANKVREVLDAPPPL